MKILLVNVTAGSPYYNPHIQRPALYPPSDGYQPPEDPLVGVARQMDATRRMKQNFPTLIFVGTAYTYLQDYLPHVAQAALREGWVDLDWTGPHGVELSGITVGCLLGKALCSTNWFAERSAIAPPRRGRGCPPDATRDSYYKNSDHGAQLKVLRKRQHDED